ncbi:hypothetical protein CEXT_503561 [Caerostris extrusa]|uniref:Uncharacterized protein n=1 Tax=Caerostris extrusa TaxID=172846 RepID=A0AAV4VSN9_CAEEX|nr:hypothetical protein CEXT_503561 [Caerostris extrusa]
MCIIFHLPKRNHFKPEENPKKRTIHIAIQTERLEFVSPRCALAKRKNLQGRSTFPGGRERRRGLLPVPENKSRAPKAQNKPLPAAFPLFSGMSRFGRHNSN